MKRKLILSFMIIMFALIIWQTSYAAVEIVPSKSGDGRDAFVNIRVTESFMQCRQMKETGGSLKGVGSNVEPHLATNKDWGAVSYLSNSIYGTNTVGGNNGIQITIDGVKYYSTTTNITGVMNWGNNPNKNDLITQTAGLINSYDSSTSRAASNIEEMYNSRSTKYVDYISPTSRTLTLGMAMYETSNKFSNRSEFIIDESNDCPISIRSGLFGGGFGSTRFSFGVFNWCNGGANSKITFRPVIWN